MSNKYKSFRNGGSSSRYEYITSSDQLMNAYIDSRKDLNDWVMKQIKRDRYLVNKAALQRSIQDTVIQTMLEGSGKVAEAAAQDIVNRVHAAFGSGSASSSNNFSVQLGEALGRGLGQAPFQLLDEIMKETLY